MVIEGNISKFNERAVPVNFVSVAVLLKVNREPYHAAILIRHLSKDYLFHFPGMEPPIIEDLENKTLPKVLVYKILENFDITDSGDVGSFLQHCKRVCKETDLTYGFIFDNSTYDNDGRYISLSGLPEIATCVGFCVNILSTAIFDVAGSYFNLSEWDTNGMDKNWDEWAESETEKKYPSLDWNLYNSFKKRISPMEYLGSSFCNVYPITKDQLNKVIPDIKLEIEKIV